MSRRLVFDSPAFRIFVHMDDDELTQLVLDGVDAGDRAAFEPVFEYLKSTGETCPWCFDRVRRLYPNHTASRVRSLQDRGTDSISLESLGATVRNQAVEMKNVDTRGIDARGDGSLMVNRPDGDADPAAYQEVAPHTRLPAHPWQPGDTRYVPPRSTTICKTCSIIDHDFSEPRSRSILLDAMVNVGFYLHHRYLLFDTVAAQKVVYKACERPCLGGRDLDVLRNAVAFGLYQAYLGSGESRLVECDSEHETPEPHAPNTAPESIAQFGD